MTLPEAKAALRRTMRERVEKLSPAERASGAARICQQVRAQEFWKSAKVVLLFAPLPSEVDAWPLVEAALAEGKLVALPRFERSQNCYVAAEVKNLGGDLVTGAFGIREPATHCREMALAKVDLALVPGLAFDASGRRLGRGKGFYDRLLAGFMGFKCGLALEVQVAPEIPTEAFDVRMDSVIKA